MSLWTLTITLPAFKFYRFRILGAVGVGPTLRKFALSKKAIFVVRRLPKLRDGMRYRDLCFMIGGIGIGLGSCVEMSGSRR